MDEQELSKIADRYERVTDRVRKHLGRSDKKAYLTRALDALEEANQKFEKQILYSETNNETRSYRLPRS